MEIKEFHLKKLEIRKRIEISNTIRKTMKIEEVLKYKIKSTIYEMTAYIMSQDIGKLKIPKNWWQALKEVLFVGDRRDEDSWVVTVWPVKYKEFNVEALFTDFVPAVEGNYLIIARVAQEEVI